MAVAVEAQNKQQPGVVAFIVSMSRASRLSLTYRQVGALPDMLTFTPDGSKVVVANEENLLTTIKSTRKAVYRLLQLKKASLQMVITG